MIHYLELPHVREPASNWLIVGDSPEDDIQRNKELLICATLGAMSTEAVEFDAGYEFIENLVDDMGPRGKNWFFHTDETAFLGASSGLFKNAKARLRGMVNAAALGNVTTQEVMDEMQLVSDTRARSPNWINRNGEVCEIKEGKPVPKVTGVDKIDAFYNHEWVDQHAKETSIIKELGDQVDSYGQVVAWTSRMAHHEVNFMQDHTQLYSHDADGAPVPFLTILDRNHPVRALQENSAQKADHYCWITRCISTILRKSL